MAGATGVEKATLIIYEPPAGGGSGPGGEIGKVQFQFNPTELSLSKSANWLRVPAVATTGGEQPEFQGSEARSLSLSILLDTSGDPSSNAVRESVERLFSCLQVTQSSLSAKRPSPPWVKFLWGTFATVGFTAYVSSVDASYTVFSSGGNPVRATCHIVLQEIPKETPGQNPTSGALTARRLHRLVAGDSLHSLAWREYGEVSAWRAIAEANDIDDPMRLTPGTELLLPAAEEV